MSGTPVNEQSSSGGGCLCLVALGVFVYGGWIYPWMHPPEPSKEQVYQHKVWTYNKLVSEHKKLRKRCEELRDKHISDLTTNDQDELRSCPTREQLALTAETDQLLPLTPQEEIRYQYLSAKEEAARQELLVRQCGGSFLGCPPEIFDRANKPYGELSPQEAEECRQLDTRRSSTGWIQ